MSFLNISLLWMMPLVVIPLVIHWVDRRRYQTVAWPAMMFLQRAGQMRGGAAKIRRWLILTLRVLAIALVILAFARPLSGNRFAVSASGLGRENLAIVLLDRSPSMQQRLGDGLSLQQAALRSIASTSKTLGIRRVVIVDSVAMKPTIYALDSLLEPDGSASELSTERISGASSTADLPAMFLSAFEFLQQTEQPISDVWVCSDGQSLDWKVDSAIWQRVNRAAGRLTQQVRFHRIRFPDQTPANASVHIASADVRSNDGLRELRLSIEVRRQNESAESVPVRLAIGVTPEGLPADVNGPVPAVTQTEIIDVAVTQGEGRRSDVRIPLPPSSSTIFGRVSIPADRNLADDQFFFALTEETGPPIGLVTQNVCDGLHAAADVLGQVVIDESAAGMETNASFAKDLSSTQLLIWQGSLPSGIVAGEIKSWVNQGGDVVCFPPAASESSGSDESSGFLGVHWADWQSVKGSTARWQEDLEFPLERFCKVDGDVVTVASVGDEHPVISNRPHGKGTVWYCGVDVSETRAVFVQDGLALYALLANALESNETGPEANAGQNAVGRVAGALRASDGRGAPELVLGTEAQPNRLQDAIEFGHHAGVYRLRAQDGAIERRMAINPPLAEFDLPRLGDLAIQELMPSIDWNPVDLTSQRLRQSASSSQSGFVREIWSTVWILLIAAMLCEAWCSLPAAVRSES